MTVNPLVPSDRPRQEASTMPYSPPLASLLTAHDARGHVHLVVGRNPLAAARCRQSLEVGAVPVLIASRTTSDDKSGDAENWLPGLHHALQRQVESGAVRWIERRFEDSDVLTLGRAEVDGVVDRVFVTEGGARSELSKHISGLCRRHRIPVNVVDAPSLSTFSLLSVHADGPLQVGVTTNGRGCKLAGRVRREIAATLPKGLGDAVERLGTLRRRLRAEDEQDELQRQRQRRQLQLQSDQATSLSSSQPCNVDNVNESTESPPETDGPLVEEDDGEADDSLDQGATFNRLVDERAQGRPDEQRGRRGRWLAQMCEYWPLRRLVALTDGDVEELVRTYRVPSSPPASSSAAASGPAAEQDAQLSAAPILAAVRPNILILAGAGPGDPSLVTHATYAALQRADLVLADKLVPSAVLDLVPRRTEVRIARKFPGNADAAQDELMELARQVFARDGDGSCRGGKVVVRLKQGDPFVFGRGGEEVIEFEAGGDDSGDGSNRSKVPVRVVILPGLSSALVAPLLARIPCTMRGVADQVLVCTGTGRKGRPPEPPGYAPGRTAVFLMALHRVAALVVELTSFTQSELDGEDKENEEDVKGKVGGDAAVRLVHRRRLWPRTTPCAVIERASCSDQRIIRTTLDRVAAAVEAEGSRPPGLLVVGRACEALWSPSRKNMDVNGDDRGRGWTVEEGFEGFAGLDDGFADGILGWRRSDDTRGEGDAAS